MAGNVYTLHFKLTNGTEVPVEFIVPQGVSVTGAQIDDEGHLIITLSDGKTIDAGEIKGGDVDTENLSTATNLVNGVTDGSVCSVGTIKPDYSEGEIGLFYTAFGYESKAVGPASFAAGQKCVARGSVSRANGINTNANGRYSSVDGSYSVSNGEAAHAEGNTTEANGNYSHAEGQRSKANGKSSHAEGWYTEANGDYSHTEGEGSRTLGKWAHAEGKLSRADSDYQHVQGKYNIADTQNKYAHIVGNGEGSGDKAYSNAHTLDWNGNAWFAGDVIVGGKRQDDADAKVLATREYVDQKIGEIEIPEVPSLDGYATEKYVDGKVDGIKIPEIPPALPNPNALTFSGAVNGSYDGSAPLSVNIPDGVKSWNDLTDKPFGNVVEDGYIVPEKTVAVDMDSGDGLRGFLMTEKLNTPVVGKSYAVKWNGADYNCTAFESDAEGFAGAVLLGNKALITGEISEEPFILVFGEQDMDGVTVYCTGIALDGSNSVTFSIHGEMEYAKQIDSVYLPEDYINALIDAKIAAMLANK